jgi:hypothetical protein
MPSAVHAHSIPAVGFVNEGKLFVEGEGPGDVDGRIGPQIRRQAIVTFFLRADSILRHRGDAAQRAIWFQPTRCP